MSASCWGCVKASRDVMDLLGAAQYLRDMSETFSSAERCVALDHVAIIERAAYAMAPPCAKCGNDDRKPAHTCLARAAEKVER